MQLVRGFRRNLAHTGLKMRLHIPLDARIVLSSLVLLCISAEPVQVSTAQDSIRVQSHEVLVPTVVFDKVIYAQPNKIKPHRRDS